MKFLKINPMKKVPGIIFMILLFSCSSKSRFEINGVVSDSGQKMVYLDEQEVTKTTPVDSFKIKKNGSFRFTGKINYPKFYNLHPDNNQIIPLLISPGEKIFIQTRGDSFSRDYMVEGSEGSRNIKSLNDTLSFTIRKLDSLEAFFKDPSLSAARINEIQQEYINIIENQRKFTLRFVLGHMTSMESIYALYQKLDDETFVLYKNRDIQILKITGASLDTIYPESSHVRALVTNAASLENQVYSSGLRNLIQSAESGFPEIALPDPSGDTIKLSSLTGKVILLSFWASWDKNSVNMNPSLVELYKRYHSRGLEIYQVSLDYNKEAWINAIEFDELPWINVSDLSYPESIIAGVYNIQSLPANYLINRSGQIVGKNYSVQDLNSIIPDLFSN
jgi:thiol-disulfide isomerase/thioredoxin